MKKAVVIIFCFIVGSSSFLAAMKNQPKCAGKKDRANNFLPSLRFLSACYIARDVLDKKKLASRAKRLKIDHKIENKIGCELYNFVKLLANTNFNIQDAFLRAIYCNARRYPLNDIDDLMLAGAEINAKDSQGNLPLLQAVKRRSLPLVEKLLDMGADIEGEDARKMKPLQCAICKRYTDIMPFLLDYKKV